MNIGLLKQPSLQYKDDEYCQSLLPHMHGMQKNGQLTDIILEVESDGISCHSVVLAAASPYFKELIISNTDIQQSGVLEVTDISFATLQLIVQHMYTAETTIDAHNFSSLLQASEKLQMKGLRNACDKFLDTQLKKENCVKIFASAGTLQLPETRNKAKTLIQQNFCDISNNNDFLELSIEDLKEIITDPDLNVRTEDPVVTAVVGWIEHDLEHRRPLVADVLQHVRLMHCSKPFLQSYVMNHPIFRDSKCLEIIFESSKFHMTDMLHQHTMCLPRNILRNHYQVKQRLIMTVSMVRQQQPQMHFYSFQEQKNMWIELKVKINYPKQTQSYMGPHSLQYELGIVFAQQRYAQTPSDKITICLVPDQMFFIGDTGAYLFNTKTNTVDKAQFIARDARSLLYFDNNVYIFQQNLCSYNLKQLESGNAEMKHYPCPHGLGVDCVMVWNGRFIYIVTTHAEFHAFDPFTEAWFRKSRMPEASPGASAVSYNDQIYVLGGEKGVCLKYDTPNDTWTRHASPATVQRQTNHGMQLKSSATVWNNKILLMDIIINHVKGIQEYDPTNDTWQLWGNLDTSISGWNNDIHIFNIRE